MATIRGFASICQPIIENHPEVKLSNILVYLLIRQFRKTMSGIPIINSFADNKADKLSDLYDRYANVLYNYASGLGFPKDICMDAIHDVFCKLALNESRIEKFTGENHEKFYLFCCLKNRLIDISRRESRTDCFCSEIVPSGFEISIEESLADEEEYQRLKAKVEELMSELTPSQKEAVYLRYMQEMSYEEIAQLLNITPESARKNVFRAMNKMRLAAKRNPTLAFFLLFIHF
ncbi:RNA polymerase sigma factor [Alistipes provencensis]|uniref:RNA polymerase sigma factor n=1 Tax=Alistipes provencensis TaxID=1816676 RepID=UPI0009ECF8DA|nr:sigma-70 family RNA polymerase sigma factor [Alistipes provencensis]